MFRDKKIDDTLNETEAGDRWKKIQKVMGSILGFLKRIV